MKHPDFPGARCVDNARDGTGDPTGSRSRNETTITPSLRSYDYYRCPVAKRPAHPKGVGRPGSLHPRHPCRPRESRDICFPTPSASHAEPQEPGRPSKGVPFHECQPPPSWRPSRDCREPTGYPCPATASQSSGWALNGRPGGSESAGSGVSCCWGCGCWRVKLLNFISVDPFLRVGPKVVVQAPGYFGGWVRAALAPGPPAAAPLMSFLFGDDGDHVTSRSCHRWGQTQAVGSPRWWLARG